MSTGAAVMWSTGMSKYPMVCSEWMSSITTRVAPASVSRFAASFAAMLSRPDVRRSARA